MLRRRTFVQSVGAALVCGVTGIEGGSRLNIGIGTYSYHSLSVDDMIAQLTTLRIREIEMSRGEFMLMHRPSDDMFRSARAKLDRAGIRCVSYYSATIREDRELDDAVRFAQLLGASNVTGDATGDMLTKIDERFSRVRLTFGIHNHYFKGRKFAYETTEDILKGLAGRSKTVGCTLDTGQMASCGHDPVDAVRKLARHLKLVHLRDVPAAGAEYNAPLGEGIARIREVMEELRKQAFKGLVAIEYEKEGRVEDDVKREVELARKLA